MRFGKSASAIAVITVSVTVLAAVTVDCAGKAPSLLIPGDELKDDAAKKDLQKLQGNWTVISMEVNGNKVPQDKIGDPKVVFKGEQYSIHDFRLTVKIDPTKKPKTIDMDGKDGNGKPLTMIGIYELEGDTLKICFAKPGEKERPSTFETKPKSGQSLIHYNRVKEK